MRGVCSPLSCAVCLIYDNQSRFCFVIFIKEQELQKQQKEVFLTVKFVLRFGNILELYLISIICVLSTDFKIFMLYKMLMHGRYF